MSHAAPAPVDATSGEPVLSVKDLSVHFFVEGEWFPAAEHLTYDVHPGEIVAIVGESGSGKSQSSLSIMGLLPANGRASGSATLGDRELIGMSAGRLRRVRGAEISMIFQEPMTALNPLYSIGFQIVETLRNHFPVSPDEASERALELLRLVEMPEPEVRYHSYPHQLSGGQRQRAMIAQALACDPKLLIADEPTTALDVTVQGEILKLMRDLRERISSGIILITHDMGVVADMADRILVMRKGVVVEQGDVDAIFQNPQHPYTQELLAAVPHLGSSKGRATTAPRDADGMAADPVLVAEEMVIEYPGRRRTPAFRAVDGVTLRINPGEVVGLVGESGSGKSTIGRAVVGLLPTTAGSLKVAGTDMVGISRSDLRKVRNQIGIVFQDPGSSLNPRLPIGESIGEPLMLQEGVKGAALNRAIEELLDQVHLPRSMRNRYPHELSGGQRQRVGIARALSLRPKLLVADEPTSALDVSVQAHVLELFQVLQREHGFACLFISHDLAVVEMLSDSIAVLQRGCLVEHGPTEQIVHSPKDEYTQRLIAAVPVPDPAQQRRRRAHNDQILEAAQAELAAGATDDDDLDHDGAADEEVQAQQRPIGL